MEANEGVSDFTPPGESAGWVLDYIHMENFKSYENRTSIGPLRQHPFLAIVGPNGSGKSNLMDAISFVMGERTNSLRVQRLDDLIHGASISKPVANKASVSAVFRRINEADQSQNEITFTRTIRGAGSEYIVNNKVVSQQAYFNALKNVGINAKGKNFLVFQGAIESIALKNSKERTMLFEEICGSAALKIEYEQAKTRMAETEKKIEGALTKKKAIITERKEIKMEVQEAKRYNDILQDMAEKETDMALFKLHHIGSEIENVNYVLDPVDRNTTRLLNLKLRLENEIKDKKKERGELCREVTVKEALLQKLENEKSKKMPNRIAIKQKLKHIEKKLSNAEKSLKQAKDTKLRHEEDLQQLRKNLEEANNQKQSFLQLHNETEMGEELDVTLRDSQMGEYWDLKQEALRNSLKEKSALEELTKQKKDKDDVFNTLNNEKMKLEAQLDIADHGMKEEIKLSQKVSENIQELKDTLRIKEAELHPLQIQVRDAENKMTDVSQQLEKLSLEIDAAKTDRHEIARQKQKLEVIKALQSHFPGVVNRVTNLCKPVHPKYKIAITKVLGSNLDAIVVDTAKTVRQCIQYLQEQMIEPEMFLPMDLLQVKPLRTRFRDLKPRNICLAYDLLQFDKSVEKAVLHCTKSAVVCPTTQIARQVASGEFCNETTNAVSLEGTMYNSNGTISGGVADLQRRAQRWSDQRVDQLNQMEDQKVKLEEELREAIKITRNSLHMQFLEQEVAGINKRLELATTNLKTHTDKAEQWRAEKKRLELEKKKHEGKWTKAKGEVSELADKMKGYVKQINAKEDKVFADFCHQIGIPNIRAYEEKDVRAQEEFNIEKQEVENKVQEIELQVADEVSQQVTLDENISRWENTVAEIKATLDDSKNEEAEVQQEMQAVERKISKAQAEVEDVKKTVESKTKELAASNKDLVNSEKLLLKFQKEKNHLENSLNRVKLQRHELYKQCKLSGTNLPFTAGSMEDIYVGSNAEGVNSQATGRLTQEAIIREDDFQLDFERVSAELKELTGDAIKEAEKKFEDELLDLESKIRAFQGPNMKADEKWDNVNTKVRQQQEEFEEIRKEVQQAREAFEAIKIRRHEKFMECYDKISQNIDGIYKGLTQNESAQAIIGLDNPEEPYLDGVSYHCVAPGKRFQSMNNLSGGEKTLAALALLFAIQSYEPAPFFVLDEIDAALDNTNIGKVTSYIRRKSNSLQFLVISLKEEFFEDADALVGIAPNVHPSECLSSNVYSLDLANYLNN